VPTVIREFARASAGEVGVITAGVFSSGELLTAVRNGSDNLELILWGPGAVDLTLTRLADSGSQALEVGGIALAMMGRRCLTAVQNANGYLLLIPWALESDGTLSLSRLEYADHQAGKASYLTIAPLTDSLAVTAVRNGAGNLLLTPWSVDATTGHVSRLNTDSAQGGPVGYTSTSPPSLPVLEGPLIATAALDASSVFTAKVNGSGELELAAWGFNSAFTVIPRGQLDVGRVADFLCIAPLGDPGPVRDFVLAFRDVTTRYDSQKPVVKRELVVTIWRVSKLDQTISQVAEASAGELTAVGLAAGTTAVDGRPIILVSARAGDGEGPQPRHSVLIDSAFRLISDSTDRVALIRTGEAQAHDRGYDYVFSTAPVYLGPGRFAKAVGHDAGLGVVAYNVSDLSATLVRPLAEGTAGDASAIRVRAVNSDQAIVALRNGSGKLELIGWQLAARDFEVRRAADTASHPIEAQEVALGVIGRRAVTAIRSSSGRLRLDSWDLSPDLSSINWMHETGTAAGDADLVTATVLDPNLVVTAVRNASGNLLLIVWRLESDGTLSRLNHESAQAGEFDAIDLITLDASNVITAVRNGSGHLQLIGWNIGTNGSVTRWAADGNAGDVSALAIAALDGTGSTREIVSVVRDGSDRLLLIAWRVSVDDRTVIRLTDSGDLGHEDGEASDLSLCVNQSPPSGRQTIVTAQRRESGNLKLTAWQLLDDPTGVPMLVQTGDMTNRADTEIQFTACCPLETGRIVLAAKLDTKSTSGLWVSTMQLRDAQAPAAAADILELRFDNRGPPIATDVSWAKSGGKTYPTDTAFEWAQVQDPTQEDDDSTLIGASGWVVAPEDSGADVPFSHPFGFDWEFSIALDAPSQGLLSPANAGAEERGGNPNHNSIALADQLGLTVPEGLLGLEWDKGLLATSYRGQVNHGDRVAVLGRWILDQGHDVGGFDRTEIHPPLLVASGTVAKSPDGSVPSTRVLFMSRPYLGGQTFTTNLDTRYVDGVDDDGPLYEHAKSELFKVLTVASTMIEIYPKIRSKPFRGSHHAQFVVRPPGGRPASGGEAVVSYRFTVRTPCRVMVEPLDDEAVLVTVDLRERAERMEYQSPRLPPRREETYSTDELDLLSPGAGDQIGVGERLIEGLLALLIGVIPAYYIRLILNRGMKTDVFESLPEIDVLDPSGGVADVPVQQIIAGAGVVQDDDQAYPVTGWIEAYWAHSPIG
jgi:hypothetical protein